MCSTCIRSLGPFRISLFNITSLAWTHLFMQRNFKSYCYSHQKTICSTNITAINCGAYYLLLMWSVLLSDICKVLKAAYDVWHISLQKHEDGREMQCGHDRKVTQTWLRLTHHHAMRIEKHTYCLGLNFTDWCRSTRLIQVRYEVKITHASDCNFQLMCSLMLGYRASKFFVLGGRITSVGWKTANWAAPDQEKDLAIVPYQRMKLCILNPH